MSGDVDLPALASRCPVTLSGADLYALCADAWMEALKRHIALLEAGEAVEQAETAPPPAATAATAALPLVADAIAGAGDDAGTDRQRQAAAFVGPSSGADLGTLGLALMKKREAKRRAAAAGPAGSMGAQAPGPADDGCGSPPGPGAHATAHADLAAAGASATSEEAAASGSGAASQAAAPASSSSSSSSSCSPTAPAPAAPPLATALGEAASAGNGSDNGVVVVCQADFLRALASLTPSLGPSELAKYHALREQYEGRKIAR